MQVLIVDDEPRIVSGVRKYFERAGFDVLAAYDGPTGLSLARAKDITLDVRLSDAPLMVSGDDQRLAQVLLNLLSNALQHTPPDGQVTVDARQVEGEIHVRVQDTGKGVPAKDLPHIFDRLYRADRARSRDTGGSGLGLSITRSLVEAHGGRIWVHSTEDEGSAFTFALPLNPRDEQKPGTT